MTWTSTFARLLITLSLLAASCNAAEQAQPPSDLELTKLMGPPFYSGEVLPTPRQAVYDDEYLTLVDGAQGALTAELRERQETFLASSNVVTLEEVEAWSTGRRLWNNTIGMLGPLL